jgi:ribosomal-protein-alanine N-acetyltransferase
VIQGIGRNPAGVVAMPAARAPIQQLINLFAALEGVPHFTPHAFDAASAQRIRALRGRDIYVVCGSPDQPLAGYGMLRGWDAGYKVPSLGIAVRADARGRGVGAFLMDHLHAEARRAGAREVRLRVHPDNTSARRLYERLGYHLTGDERGQFVMTFYL